MLPLRFPPLRLLPSPPAAAPADPRLPVFSFPTLASRRGREGTAVADEAFRGDIEEAAAPRVEVVIDLPSCVRRH